MLFGDPHIIMAVVNFFPDTFQYRTIHLRDYQPFFVYRRETLPSFVFVEVMDLVEHQLLLAKDIGSQTEQLKQKKKRTFMYANKKILEKKVKRENYIIVPPLRQGYSNSAGFCCVSGVSVPRALFQKSIANLV